MDFEFKIKTNALFGEGKALDLAERLKKIGFAKIGLIVDSAVACLPYTQEIIEGLKNQAFDFLQIWTYDLGAEPDYQSLDKIKLAFLDDNSQPTIDCLTAIGGGSVIDFAKGIATLVKNPGPGLNYRGFPENLIAPLPVIALPTTAGTGSEATFNAVFIDKEGKKKLGINSLLNFPVLAILDPKLVASCPKKIAVSSGMDALTHALESYTACQATPISRVFSQEAFRLIFNNLEQALDYPGDLSAWQNLQIGAYLAGIALINSGSGPSGALSYALGVHFSAPHGLAGAIFLPHIIKHNVDNGYDYSQLYDLIKQADLSTKYAEKSQIFAEKIFQLCSKIGAPEKLNDFGVNQNNVKVLLSAAETMEKAFLQNPIPFSIEQAKKLILQLTN